MLEKVLTYIHNWYERDVQAGTWRIEGGTLDLQHVQPGQFYRICGSVFNDGLHQHPADDLTDEEFKGAVWALAIPPALLELVGEIEEWQAANGSAAESPFASESFENYSYTKGSAAGSSSADPSNGWQRHFMARLVPYRKLG